MHRELSHADAVFGRPRTLGLYLFTALLGVLLALDLLPAAAGWLGGWGVTPPWGRELFGYRFALIAAVLGGARVLYGALDRLLDGRVGADLALAIACVAAIEAFPICATSVVKIAKALMSRNHWPPIGAPVCRKRRIAARSGRTGRV